MDLNLLAALKPQICSVARLLTFCWRPAMVQERAWDGKQGPLCIRGNHPPVHVAEPTRSPAFKPRSSSRDPESGSMWLGGMTQSKLDG